MRNRLRSIVDDVGLMEIAIGVALALALVDLASALGQTIVTYWQTPAPDEYADENATALALESLFTAGQFEIAGHLLDVSGLVRALVEVLIVLAVAVWLWPRRRMAEEQP